MPTHVENILTNQYRSYVPSHGVSSPLSVMRLVCFLIYTISSLNSKFVPGPRKFSIPWDWLEISGPKRQFLMNHSLLSANNVDRYEIPYM